MSDATPEISVIICTRNPRAEYLRRVLEALRAQTLAQSRWELVLVDNASSEPLDGRVELGVANGRIVREMALGLANARLCGIRESRGAILVFVDDDNILDADYLEHALAIGSKWAILGTWGGQAVPEFEETPAEWTRDYWNWIGIRTFTEPLWSNIPRSTATAPFGAGMCVRRSVAEAYMAKLANDPVRRSLGRTGTQLFGSEDSDLAFTSCDLGLGNGIFPELKLTHCMPKNRLTEEYLLRLVEAQTYSHTLLDLAQGESISPESRSERLLSYYQSFFIPERTKRFDKARRRGRDNAVEAMRKMRESHG